MKSEISIYVEALEDVCKLQVYRFIDAKYEHVELRKAKYVHMPIQDA